MKKKAKRGVFIEQICREIVLNVKTDLHKEFYQRINKKRNYEELTVIREEGESVTIFGRMADETIKEMVVLVGGVDNVLVYLKGKFSADLLKNKVDLTGTEKFLSFNF